MGGDPIEEILEGDSHVEALEKTIEWLELHKRKMKDDKVVVHVFQSKGKWKAFIRYITA